MSDNQMLSISTYFDTISIKNQIQEGFIKKRLLLRPNIALSNIEHDDVCMLG